MVQNCEYWSFNLVYFTSFQYVQVEPPTNKGLANLTGQLLQFQEVLITKTVKHTRNELMSNSLPDNINL